MAGGGGRHEMTYQEPLSRKAVAISISESPDMAVLGLAEEHLRDAMAEVARHLLAMGARLVYGGDLRAYGFTELLFELVARHRRDADVGDDRAGVVSYLPWPVHAAKPAAELHALAKDLAGVAELHCLDRVGNDIPFDTLAAEPEPAASDEEWAEGLTAMRAVLTRVSDARVVLGGRVTGFKGRMPGVAEEAFTALQAGQPLFLIGGFGGCGHDIAEDLGLVPPRGVTTAWPGRDAFRGFDASSLRNALTADENRTLARTVHVDEAVALILRGLLRLAGAAPAAPDAC
jgi:hypothetical protein